MSAKPELSIIIPTLNEEKYLPLLLKCLKVQSFQDFEIIVADAGSSDNTIKIVRKYGAKLTKGGIPALGRNEGARLAKSETLAFIDADITFSSNFLLNVMEEFKITNSDIATCPNTTASYKFINLLMYSSKYLPFKYGNTQFLICKKKVFDTLNGFNSEIEVAEDIDFIRRADKLKHKYSILKVFKIPSNRRYKKNSFLKVLVGYLLSLVFVYFPSTRTNKAIKKIIVHDLIGGWGKF